MKKRDKRAQAQIITVVLIILLVLAAIIIIWNVVKETIKESSGQVGVEAFIVQLEVKEAQAGAGGGLEVKVHRSSGKGTITSLKFILEDSDGQTYTETISENLPDELETKIYNVFGLLDEVVEVKKISVVPVVGDKFGIEATKNIDVDVFTMTGLVSWWDFDGDFNDSVGGNHGVNYSDAHIENGELVLDGDGDYVDAGSDSSIDGNVNEAFSISVWVKPNDIAVASNPHIISKVDDSAASDGYTLFVTGNKIRFWVEATTADTIVLSNDVWYHIIGIWNGTHINIYRDGILDKSTSRSVYNPAVSKKLGFGARAESGNNPFNGILDNVMIFNRSLSENEIKTIYNSQKK